MTKTELDKIMGMPSLAIIAPAGHGKTEMIADIIQYSNGKQLILTHTNAGVDAINERLQKRKISKEKYTVTTIAAFCIKWCISYNITSDFDKELSPLNGGIEAKTYYEQLYYGAKKIFETLWSGSVLKSTYVGVIVDEYQDCIQVQHEIVLAMNKHLPVKVLGDPMQGIFSFAGNLVNWRNLEFPVVDIVTKPWRWNKSNPELGEYLMTVRKSLLPVLTNQHCSIEIDTRNSYVQVLAPNSFTGYSHLKEISKFSSVLYIAKWPKQQLNFCTRMSGIFQYDEKQDCDELFKYAKLLDTNYDVDLILTVIDFASECLTSVNKELSSYIKKIKTNNFDFSRIKKHPDFRKTLEEVVPFVSKEAVLKILIWFSTNPVFKKYRAELFAKMIRSIKYAIENNLTIFDASTHIRKDLELQKRYTGFKFLSSRTLLSKGLEFDCVIIDMTIPLSAKDFYVAMTRAMKQIYIISPSNKFEF